MNAEKSSRKGLLILFVGVMIGAGIGIAVCVTFKAQDAAKTVSLGSAIAKTGSTSKPLPSLYPPPPQTVFINPLPAPAPEAPPAAIAYQTDTYAAKQQAQTPVSVNYAQPGATASIAIQSQDGTLLIPGVNAYPAQTSTDQVIPQAPEAANGNIDPNWNPNWTVGRNGLLKNPCVDPPSAHGRQTGMY